MFGRREERKLTHNLFLFFFTCLLFKKTNKKQEKLRNAYSDIDDRIEGVV